MTEKTLTQDLAVVDSNSRPITRRDLAYITHHGLIGWAATLRGSDRPHPIQVQFDQGMQAMIYKFVSGEVARLMGCGIHELLPVGRVGRVIMLNVSPTSHTSTQFSLVFSTPYQARWAMRIYASAFEFFWQPSAWITDHTTSPLFRFNYCRCLMLNGSGLGFTCAELTYLLIHIQDMINQVSD